MAEYTFTNNIDRPILASTLQATDDVVGSLSFTFNGAYNVLKMGSNNSIHRGHADGIDPHDKTDIAIIGHNNVGATNYGVVMGYNLDVNSSYATIIGSNSTFNSDINGSTILTRNSTQEINLTMSDSVGLVNNTSYIMLNDGGAHITGTSVINISTGAPPRRDYPEDGALTPWTTPNNGSSIILKGNFAQDISDFPTNIYHTNGIGDSVRNIKIDTCSSYIDSVSLIYPKQKKIIYAATNLSNIFKSSNTTWTGYTAKYNTTVNNIHYCYLNLPLNRICQFFNCSTSAVKTYTYTIYITKPFATDGSGSTYMHSSVITLYPGSSSTQCDIDNIINSSTYINVAPINGSDVTTETGQGWGFSSIVRSVNLNFKSATANTDALAGAYAPKLLNATIKFEVEWY